MGPRKRGQPDRSELEDLVAKHARIEEFCEEHPESCWTGVNERTFVAVKPDGVQRRLVGEIVRRFEKKGFKLVGLKLVQASEELLREHYWDLRSRPFFGGLVTYMSSGPVVAMVWQGLDVVKTARKMLGETNPADSLPGTIRGDLSVEKRDPRQRLCGERAEGNLSVVSSERASPLGEQQQPLALQLTFCTNTVRS
ncbi:nucleoside diphosphate kinase 3 isoform X1 [Maylandia zebra]|uniref:nucleoside diphosphate kinase 3 isoform X1 n=1 Tax=Maylandia zebra TaxID=106582 RepID=UPI00403C8472